MNLELTDEQSALQDTVRRFLSEKTSATTNVRPMLEDPTGVTADVWKGLAALGATGVLVPQELGGTGMTMVEAGVVAIELGVALHSGPWLSSAVAATRMLTRADAADAAERHLAALRAKAFGGRLAAVGDTAIQVFGGIGYTWEHDAHLYLKRLLGWSAFLGGPDRYFAAVGKRLALSANRKDVQ